LPARRALFGLGPDSAPVFLERAFGTGSVAITPSIGGRGASGPS
jgi:hypothetical protein